MCCYYTYIYIYFFSCRVQAVNISIILFLDQAHLIMVVSSSPIKITMFTSYFYFITMFTSCFIDTNRCQDILTDETTKLSCGIFSDDQGFIYYQRYQGSQSYSRTDSLDEWMALVQSPPPSSSRKWVQLSAAFKLMFVKQSAGRRARIAPSRHQAMAARA